MAYQQTYRLPSGKLTRPDIVVEDGAGGFRGVVESKWGYASGTRVEEQAANYAQLARQLNVPLYYKLYDGGSLKFLQLLSDLGVRFI